MRAFEIGDEDSASEIAERLVALMGENPEEDFPVARFALFDAACTSLVASGREDAIFETLLSASPEQGQFLHATLEASATRRYGHVLLPSGEEDREIALFALPLLVIGGQGRELPAQIQLTDRLVGSFKRHKLLSEEAHLLLFGDLYSLRELNQSVTDVYSAMEGITRSLDDLERARFALPREERRPPEAQIRLRFLVGAIIASPEDAERFFREDEAYSDLTKAEEAFALTVSDELRAQGVDAMAVLVDRYYDALRDGFHHLNLMALNIHVGEALKVAPPHEIQALLAIHEGEREVQFRISLLCHGHFLAGHTWPVDPLAESFTYIADLIIDALAERGITDVGFVPEPRDIGYCDGCGEPLYLTPDGEPTHEEHLN